MAIAYIATSASIFSLHKKAQAGHFHLRGGWLIPSLGVIFSVYLITQCTILQIALGLALLLAGLPIYIKYSPKREITELKERLLSRESMLRWAHAQEERFLAHVVSHIKKVYRRVAGKKLT
jgi:hypothetical protein